jgi:hypothetical protein
MKFNLINPLTVKVNRDVSSLPSLAETFPNTPVIMVSKKNQYIFQHPIKVISHTEKTIWEGTEEGNYPGVKLTLYTCLLIVVTLSGKYLIECSLYNNAGMRAMNLKEIFPADLNKDIELVRTLMKLK